MHYMLDNSLLERTDSMTDLGVILDSKLTFKEHIDSVVNKGMSMLGFIKRMSREFRDPYTLKALYVSLVRSKIEYACCIWQPFYACHVNRIERIQENFIKFALRRLGWNATSSLPPYEDRCALLKLETLKKRRDVTRTLFIFDIKNGKIDSSTLASEVRLNVPQYSTRDREFLNVVFHRTNYGYFEPLNAAIRGFNKIAGLFDYNQSREQFLNKLKFNPDL